MKIKSRREFVFSILSYKILSYVPQIQENEEIHIPLVEELVQSYLKNQTIIEDFIENNIKNKVLDVLQQTLICCGISELIMGADGPLIIKEYMIISDKFGCSAPLVNAALDTFLKQNNNKST